MLSTVAESTGRLGRCRWGASAVAFAVVFSPLLLVLFGILICGSSIASPLMVVIGLPFAIAATVSGILAGAVSPVDPLMSSVLATLGVGLGQADVRVAGIRCDGAVLVL